MSLTILLGKTPYPLASAEGWRKLSDWVETLKVPLENLEELCVSGSVQDTEQLEHEVREAIAQRPPAPVRDTLAHLASSIAGGSPNEVATVVGAGETTIVANAFCPTGPGGGQDNSCPPATKGMPSKPEFLSSQKGNVQANLKAVDEMKNLAEISQVSHEQGLPLSAAGHLDELKEHPGTPSPKVQAYKQALIAHLENQGIGKGLVPQTVSAASVPSSASDLKYVQDLPGSTSPKLMEDDKGNKWVLKSGTGTMPTGGTSRLDHIKNEDDVAAAYRALGVKVPDSGFVGSDRLSQWVDGPTLAEWKSGKSLDEMKTMKAAIAKNFVADALLGNWDVAGSNQDNIKIVNGVPYRIDVGGGLKYRAQGSPKTSSQFGAEVKELQDMRDPAKSPVASKLFNGLTDVQIKEQIKDVLSKRDQVLSSVQDPETKKILSQRFDWLKSQSQESTASGKSMASEPATGNPLHNGHGLVKHLLSQGLKMTDIQAYKTATLNPEGVKKGFIYFTLPGGKKTDPAVQGKIAQLQSMLPPGTQIKDYTAGVKKFGHTKESLKGFLEKIHSSEGGTFTFKHAQQVEGQILDKSTIQTESTYHLKTSSPLSPEHKSWAHTISAKEASAISGWKGSSKTIRKEVAQTKNNPTEGSDAYHFMSAINKQSNYQGVTYRGLHSSGGSDDYVNKLIESFKQSKIGDKWSDDAPMNTSRSPGIGVGKFSHGDLVLRIKMNTGRPTEPSDGYSSEREVIGQPNVQYRITGVAEKVDLYYPDAGYGTSKKVRMMVDLEEI